MEVKINSGLAHVSYIRNGVSFTKTFLLDSFINSLTTGSGLRTPLLPPGCRIYEKRDQRHILLIEVPPCCRNVKYINRDGRPIFEGTVPFPWMLLEVICQEESDGQFTVRNSYIYSMKRPIVSLTDELFHWPSANVFNDDRICWGSTFNSGGTISKFKSLAELGRLVDMYFSSNFNTDLNPIMRVHQRYEDLLRASQDKKVFDNNVLASAGVTVQRLLDRIGGS